VITFRDSSRCRTVVSTTRLRREYDSWSYRSRTTALYEFPVYFN